MRIGRFEIEAEAGRGGVGVVYRARARDGSRVALKLLLRKDEGALRRFEREVRLQSALGEEAGFVPVLDTGVHEGAPFLVLPFLDGGTLRARLARGPLPVAEARALGVRLARTLGAAHGLGIVHRDVKPENVLFTTRGEPLLADLGLAKHFDDSAPGASRSAWLSKTGQFLGTASYMAPEQLTDAKTAGPAADVFALGAVLYECLAGAPAFPGESVLEIVDRIERGAFAPLARFRPDVPRDFASTVERCLARDPGRRFADGAALARALTGAKPAGRRPLALVLLVLAVLGAAAGGLALRLRPAPAAPESHAENHPEPPPGPSRALALTRRALDLVAACDEHAEAASREAVAADPGFALAHAALALALASGRALDEARAEGQRATEIDPRCALGWAARSWATGSEEGLALADRALELDPKLAWGLAARAKAGSNQDPDRAEQEATRALELDPKLAVAWLLRGQLRSQRPGRDAIDDLDRAIEIAPRLVPAYYLRSLLRGVQDESAGSLSDIEQAVALDPSAQNFMYRAATRLKMGDAEGAVADASRAIGGEESDNAFAWGQRARARMALRDLERALSDATRALELEPSNAMTRLVLAEIRAARGEKAEARAEYERLKALPPNNEAGDAARRWLAENPAASDPPALLPIEEVQTALNKSLAKRDAADAMRLATLLIALAPASPQAWMKRFTARMIAEDMAGAEADITQAIELGPGISHAWSDRVILRAYRDDLAGALADSDRALALDPGNRQEWAMRARILRTRSDDKGALAAAARAVLCFPPAADAWLELGAALDANGHVAAARSAFETLLALDPKDAAARGARSWLESHPR